MEAGGNARRMPLGHAASASCDPPDRTLPRRPGHRHRALARMRLHMAAHGVTDFYEVGAGKVLSGLIKRIADGAREPRSHARTSERSRRPACGRGKTCGEVDVMQAARFVTFIT